MPTTRLLSQTLERAVQRLVGDHSAADILSGLCLRLASIVGDTGVSALLHRSWKEHAALLPDDGVELLPWAERVALLPPDLEGDTATALVTAFIATVRTFVGPSLTVRLLEDLWPELLKDPT